MPMLFVQPLLNYHIPLSQADAFELWVDKLRNITPKKLEEHCHFIKKKTQKKLVVVCKSRHEKGEFQGSDKKKVDLLIAAKKAKADYIDLTLKTQKKEIARLKMTKGKAKLILSFHDFHKTPSGKKLRNVFQKMQNKGADIVKIATFVNTVEDNERLISLALELSRKGVSHIIIGMGEKGLITRFFSKQLGNELTFVAGEEKTAEGQLDIKTIKTV